MNPERVNRTLLYGEGLFETVRVYPGRNTPLLDAHGRRMARGAEFFQFPFSKTAFAEAVRMELERLSDQADARLRVTLEVWGAEGPEESCFVTHSSPLPAADPHRQEGVCLVKAPFSRCSDSPLLGFKTTNYLENSYGRQWARQRGYYDALFFNERGEIAETATANLFLIRGRSLITPEISSGLLPGIARGVVLAIAKSVDLSVEERPVSPADLERADEVLLSNAVVEILPVKEIDGIFAGRPPYHWAPALGAKYRERVLTGESE